MAIPNLIDIDKHENSIVVNIEDTTTVTTILDEKIYNIDKIEEGSKRFFNQNKCKRKFLFKIL